jgi:hypothetical protein
LHNIKLKANAPVAKAQQNNIHLNKTSKFVDPQQLLTARTGSRTKAINPIVETVMPIFAMPMRLFVA